MEKGIRILKVIRSDQFITRDGRWFQYRAGRDWESGTLIEGETLICKGFPSEIPTDVLGFFVKDVPVETLPPYWQINNGRDLMYAGIYVATAFGYEIYLGDIPIPFNVLKKYLYEVESAV